MAQVTLQNVRQTYLADRKREVVALEKLNLEVADREFLVLLGPADCGKSTLLRSIAGLEKIDAGEIRLGDRVLNEVPPPDRGVALVFQSYALFPHLSVAENLAFGLKMRKRQKKEIEQRVAEAARLLGLEPLLARRPAELTGAEPLRVALGRAMVQQPKLILFDNPLANLDPEWRGPMRLEIKKLHQRLQTTMIYATADQTEAMTMADRVAVMQAGAIQQTDAPLALYREPANRFVAGLLGAPPMNFIAGTLKETPQGLRFREKEGGVIDGLLPARAISRPEVILGIRPEDLEFITQPDAQARGIRFQCLIDAVESQGAETHFHLETGAHRLISRSAVAVDPATMGHRGRFEFAPEKAHLFDASTGDRLS